MNIEQFREFCLKLPEVTEGFPFGGDTLVFKVNNKVFAITDIENFEYVNLKCDPDYALELRAQYESVQPGYHMHKKSWNSVYANQEIDDNFIYKLTLDSWKLIVQGMKKVDNDRLFALLGD
jgi:predicted DNA-binding protein (MmcQ/YjbR family)